MAININLATDQRIIRQLQEQSAALKKQASAVGNLTATGAQWSGSAAAAFQAVQHLRFVSFLGERQAEAAASHRRRRYGTV